MKQWYALYVLLCSYCKVWDSINYPFPNINDLTVEDREVICDFINNFTGYVITYPCADLD